MFLRIVRAAGGHGVKHEYVRVVEAYRERGKTRHRTVLNLGRKGPAGGASRPRQADAPAAWRGGAGARDPARGCPRHGGVGLGTDAGGAPPVVPPIGSPRRPASMVWRAGWRPTSSATATAAASCRRGATMPRARRAGRRGCGSRRGNSSIGTARSINCWRSRRRSSTPCFSPCAACFRCASTWCSMT
jgi:hypothetical protein